MTYSANQDVQKQVSDFSPEVRLMYEHATTRISRSMAHWDEDKSIWIGGGVGLLAAGLFAKLRNSALATSVVGLAPASPLGTIGTALLVFASIMLFHDLAFERRNKFEDSQYAEEIRTATRQRQERAATTK